MPLRYSSSVVAPTHWSSPRDSAGLMMFAGPDDRVQLVDEQNDLAGVADLVDDRLDPLFELAAVFGSRHHERQVDRIDHLVREQVRHLLGDDRLRQPFEDGGFADAGLADQDRVVLGPPAEHLDHAFDFVRAPDHRVEFALRREIGQVAPEGVQGVQPLLAALLRSALAALLLRREVRRFGLVVIVFGQVVRVERLDDRLPHLVEIHVQILQYPRGGAFAFAQDREQQVLGADEVVVHRLRLGCGQHQNALEPRRQRQRPVRLGRPADSAGLFDLQPELGEIEPERFQHVDRDSLVQAENAEQQVLGADMIVIEPLGLLLRKKQDLPCARCQIPEIVVFWFCHYAPPLKLHQQFRFKSI